MNLWQYQSQLRWADTNGMLTDQSRLWLNTLFKTVTTAGAGPVQLGGDIGGTSVKPIVIGLQGKAVSAALPTNGQVLAWSSTNNDWEPKTAAAGSVTSVGLAMPPEFTVTGSPVTAAGTLTAAKASQNANTFWGGPASGAPAAPVFRALAAADIPASSSISVKGVLVGTATNTPLQVNGHALP
jgi:hypothetical protein